MPGEDIRLIQSIADRFAAAAASHEREVKRELALILERDDRLDVLFALLQAAVTQGEAKARHDLRAD